MKALLGRTGTLGVLLALVPLHSASFATWNRHELREWIVNQRPADPPELAGKLPEWPEWRGFCPGLGNYFVNVGREFRRLCGPQLEAKKKAVLKCRETMPPLAEWSPDVLLSQAGRCTAAGAGAFSVWRELAQCTLTSYITATDMTEQQRREWGVFISGITDLDSLLKLGSLFSAGKFAEVGNVKAPRNLKEAIELAELGKELAAEPGARIEKLKKAPVQIGGVRAALETLPFFEEWQYDRMREEAATLLEGCQPEAARDAYTRAELAHFQRIQAARAALVLAEEQYYCAAMANRFESVSEVEQGYMLSKQGRSVFAMALNKIHLAELDHRAALDSYKKFLADPAFADDRFAYWKDRQERLRKETRELSDVAEACSEGCGDPSDDCRYPLETVESFLRAKADDVCSTALGLEDGLAQMADHVDRVRTASANYRQAFDRYEPKITSLLGECRVNEAMFQVVELEREIRQYERFGARVEACWDSRLRELQDAIEKRRATLTAQVEKAEGLVATGRRSAEACDWDAAEASVSAAYDAALATGCPQDDAGLAGVYDSIDSLLQRVSVHRTEEETARQEIERRAADLSARARADLELAQGDGSGRCEAAAGLRAAAEELAGLRVATACPDTGTGYAGEARMLAEAAERASSRNRSALESMLTTAQQAEQACDVDDLSWAAAEVASLPPVCGVDVAAAAAGLRDRHRRLTEARRNARDYVRGLRQRLDGAVAVGSQGQANALREELERYAPADVPRACYADLLEGISAARDGDRGGGPGFTAATGISTDASSAVPAVDPRGGVGGSGLPPPPSIAPSREESPLQRAAKAAWTRCDLERAVADADSLAVEEPGNAWLAASRRDLEADAARKRTAEELLRQARSHLAGAEPTSHDVTSAANLARQAQEMAPKCMSQAVSGLTGPIRAAEAAAKARDRASAGAALSDFVTALTGAITAATTVVAAPGLATTEIGGRDLPSAVAALSGAGRAGGGATSGAVPGAAGGTTCTNCIISDLGQLRGVGRLNYVFKLQRSFPGKAGCPTYGTTAYYLYSVSPTDDAGRPLSIWPEAAAVPAALGPGATKVCGPCGSYEQAAALVRRACPNPAVAQEVINRTFTNPGGGRR